MQYAVVYSSKTGNTRLLAEQIQKQKGSATCIYFGEPNAEALQADVLYIGFWTDKGSCDAQTKAFLSEIHQKTVYLFGTAGFGKSQSYFDKILQNVTAEIPDDNVVHQGFMCQGKMPQAVRKHYESMLEKNPNDAKAQMLLDNFDMALTHPDATDLQQLQNWLLG